jgi:hypothetical protein
MYETEKRDTGGASRSLCKISFLFYHKTGEDDEAENDHGVSAATPT